MDNEHPPADLSNGPISRAVLDCLDSFRRLMSMRKEPAAHAVLPKIRDEETRFKVWSGNIGAHKEGRSSLDYRLRDASHLQAQVIGLLAELTTLLEDVIAIVQGEKIPWEMLDELPLREEEEDGGIAETELGQIATDVVEVVNCLLRLSVSIRNPAPHDRLKSSTGNKTNLRRYEVFDIQHVRSKFGSLNDTIARRLGKAISKRREYFRYRESHHAKLSHGLESDLHHEELGSTVASSIPQQMKDPGVAAGTHRMMMPVVDEDASSVLNMSETSFASSTGGNETLRVPPLPKEAHRGPFECPFCFMMIVATNTRLWKRHVYADLRPYVCLSDDCQTPETEFDRRRDWMQHELQNHWKTYTCPFGCPDDSRYPSATALRGHLNNKHKSNMSSGQLDALIDLSAQPLKTEDGIDCRLCGKTLFSIPTYGRHVGRHQEQISLFALPSLAHADGDERIDGEESTGSDSEAINEATNPREPITTRATRTGATNDDDITLRVMGAAIVQVAGSSLEFTDGGEINIAQRKKVREPGGSHPGQVDQSQPTSERPRFIFERGPDRQRMTARVDDVDKSGNIVEGTDRYAESVYNPRVPSPHTNRIERSRNPSDQRRMKVSHVEDTDDSANFIKGRDRYAEEVSSPTKEMEIPKTGRTRMERSRDLESRFQTDPTPTRTKKPDKGMNATHFGIVQPPAPRFPEEKTPTREGVGLPKNYKAKQGISSTAEWTNIPRDMVSPEVLVVGKEIFEIRDDFVTVLRGLSMEEIHAYAAATVQLREKWKKENERGGRPQAADTTWPAQTSQVSYPRPPHPASVTPVQTSQYRYSPPPAYPFYPSQFAFPAPSPNPGLTRMPMPRVTNLEISREAPEVIQPSPPTTQDNKLPQHKPPRPPKISNSKSGTRVKDIKPTINDPKEGSYYGVASPTLTPSGSTRPQSVYMSSRPPPANERWYQNQAPPQSQQPAPAAESYPLPSWGGEILPPPPLPTDFQLSPGNFLSRPLQVRFNPVISGGEEDKTARESSPEAIANYDNMIAFEQRKLKAQQDALHRASSLATQLEEVEGDGDKKRRSRGQDSKPIPEAANVETWETYNKLEREKARLNSLNDPIFASAIRELGIEMNRVRAKIDRAKNSGAGSGYIV